MRPLDRTRTRLSSARVSYFILAAVVGGSGALAQMRAPQLPIIFLEPELEPEEELPQAPNSGRSLDELITALDASSLEVRQAAHVELSRRRDFTLRQLETALDRKDLTPEQRIRLDAAALDRFVDGPRAAMGITWNTDFPDIPGIIETHEGFDAHDKLEPGDIFVAAGDQLIGAGSPQQTLRWEIISRDPGDMLKVTVMRGKEILDFNLQLGSYRQLGQGTGVLPHNDLTAAYRLRAERRGQVITGPSFGLSRDDWDNARMEGDKRFAVQMQQWRTQGRSAMVAGGAPRGGPDDDRQQYRDSIGRLRNTPTRMTNTGRFVQLEDPMERQPSRSATVGDEIRRLEQRVEYLRKEAQTPGGDDAPRRPVAIQGQMMQPLRSPAERLAAAEKMLEAYKARAAAEKPGEGEVADQPEKDPKNEK